MCVLGHKCTSLHFIFFSRVGECENFVYYSGLTLRLDPHLEKVVRDVRKMSIETLKIKKLTTTKTKTYQSPHSRTVTGWAGSHATCVGGETLYRVGIRKWRRGSTCRGEREGGPILHCVGKAGRIALTFHVYRG